jgi:hypothetical protein
METGQLMSVASDGSECPDPVRLVAIRDAFFETGSIRVFFAIGPGRNEELFRILESRVVCPSSQLIRINIKVNKMPTPQAWILHPHDGIPHTVQWKPG